MWNVIEFLDYEFFAELSRIEVKNIPLHHKSDINHGHLTMRFVLKA